MIVNATTDGWNIIFQRSHAMLALKIALEISDELRPTPWADVLAAIAEHDDGQAPWSSDRLLTSHSTPKDFSEAGFDEKQARKVVENARYKSRWITLLTSLHTSSLYKDFEDARAFLADQSTLQKKLYNSLEVTKAEAGNVYAFVRWCDECSLILCREKLKENDTPLKIGKLEYVHEIFMNEKTIHISPWPFSQPEFTLTVEYQALRKKTFSSGKALGEEVNSLFPSVKSWRFRKPGTC